MAGGISTDLVPRADLDRDSRYEQQKWIVWQQEPAWLYRYLSPHHPNNPDLSEGRIGRGGGLIGG